MPITMNFETTIQQMRLEQSQSNRGFWRVELSELDSYKEAMERLSHAEKIQMLIDCMSVNGEPYNLYDHTDNSEEIRKLHQVREAYIGLWLNTKDLSEEQILLLINVIAQAKQLNRVTQSWPIKPFLKGLMPICKRNTSDSEIHQSLRRLCINLQNEPSWYEEKQKFKLIELIDQMLFIPSESGDIKPNWFLGKDGFASFANASIEQLEEGEKRLWFQLLGKAQQATGSKPSSKWMNESKNLILELGEEPFKSLIFKWFHFIIELKETFVGYDDYPHRPAKFKEPNTRMRTLCSAFLNNNN